MRDMDRRRDCSVSNEMKKETKKEPPPGLSLGGDDRGMGVKLGPSLDCKENKGMTKDTDSHMTENTQRRGRKNLFQGHGDNKSTLMPTQIPGKKHPEIIGNLRRAKEKVKKRKENNF